MNEQTQRRASGVDHQIPNGYLMAYDKRHWNITASIIRRGPGQSGIRREDGIP